MKKKRSICFIFGFLILFLPTVTFAETEGDLWDKAEDMVGYSAFLDSVPSEILLFMEESGVDLSADSPAPDLSDFLGMLFLSFSQGLTEYIPLLSVGLILTLTFKLLTSLSSGSSRLTNALGYLAVLSSGVYSFSVLERLLDSLSTVATQVSSFLTAALPVISAAQVLSGSSEGAVTVAATLPVILSVLSSSVTAVFYPLCWFCYASALLGFSSSSVSLRPFVASVKKFCIRGIEVVSGLAVGVFCIQRVSVASADSLSRKSARFALARLLPVAGGTLSDGLETVYACGQSIRGKVGVVCVLVLVIMFATPCILGLIYMSMYSFLSSVGSVFGVSVLADFFADVKDTFAMTTCFSLCSLIVLASAILLLLGG